MKGGDDKCEGTGRGVGSGGKGEWRRRGRDEAGRRGMRA